jgi:hypothetical protein
MPGLLQHAIVRGTKKRQIFHADQDQRTFLDRFSPLLMETEIISEIEK